MKGKAIPTPFFIFVPGGLEHLKKDGRIQLLIAENQRTLSGQKQPKMEIE